MCIGIPMQVVAVEPGHAQCRGRGEMRRVSTLLIDACAPGDWLLVFIDSAREILDAARANEIDVMLDLLEDILNGVQDGGPGAGATSPFVLPSSLSAAQAAGGDSVH